MDAWDTLTQSSTLQSGTAWEHLNAQGGGSEELIVLADGMEIEIDMGDVNVGVSTGDLEVSVDQGDITIEIDQTPIEVPV